MRVRGSVEILGSPHLGLAYSQMLGLDLTVHKYYEAARRHGKGGCRVYRAYDLNFVWLGGKKTRIRHLKDLDHHYEPMYTYFCDKIEIE